MVQAKGLVGIKIILGNANKVKKELFLVASNIPEELYKQSLSDMNNIADIMRNRLNSFGGTGESAKNILVYTVSKQKNASKISLTADFPWSKVLEYGVDNSNGYWIDTSNKPKLEEWIQRKGLEGMIHFTKAGRRWFHVGGYLSNVKKNNSERQFFQVSIDSYLGKRGYQSQIKQAIRRAIR